jgi:hypothetical protein
VFFDPKAYEADPAGAVAGWHDATALAKKHNITFFVFFAFVDIPPLSTPHFSEFLYAVFTEFNDDDAVTAFVIDVEPAVSSRTPAVYMQQVLQEVIQCTHASRV